MSRYIDADAVKGAFQDKYVVYDDTLEIINSVPTADVRENVRGEWVKYDEGDCVCLRCGFVLDDWTQAIFYNYCPNCGADMKEVEPQLPPLDIRDCDHCKHYVTRDGQTGCEKWECEFEKED